MNQPEALPLEGVRVLDLTRHVAGPCAAMYLGDFGADVLKVEPVFGDASRTIGSERAGSRGEFSPLFLAYNRNKRGIALDLKSARGSEVFLRLVEDADVVLQSFRPGVATKLGVAYEDARRVKPDIIYCNVSGWGQTGPLRDRGAYDGLLQAYAGPMSVTGHPDGESVRIAPPTIDVLTGAHAAMGVLLALIERAVSGLGQEVDVALYDATLHLMSQFIAQWTGFGTLPRKSGARLEGAAPYGVFHASDREFFLGVASDVHWRKFCEVAELADLISDDRYATNRDRVMNQEALYSQLEPIFALKPGLRWVQLAEGCGIPSGLVNTISEVTRQQQARVREMIVPVGIGDVESAGIPIKLTRTPGSYRLSPPGIGSDTRSVLLEVGYSEVEVDELLTTGIVAYGGEMRDEAADSISNSE